MAVNINLKEIFAVDNQSDLASKLNFNFNQLIALGVGQPGGKGDTGDAGGPGPIGPIGLTGKRGSVMWSIPSGIQLDLSTSSPTDSAIGDYYVGEVTVGATTYNGIYTKTADGTFWDLVTDFDALIRSINLDQQPWATGIISQTPPARIAVLVKNSQGLDRNTIGFASKPEDYYLSYPPNWRLTTDGSQNAQGVMFNFDAYTVKTVKAVGSPGLNGYNIEINSDRLGTNISNLNTAFPYSSILSLYSFFNASDSAIEADQFIDSTGYRHQLELGSVDDIREYLNSADSGANYVISPTYQNLRIRKYRLIATELPGQSVILSDFNLHSNDSTTRPALNSKFTWSINKKELDQQGRNSIIQLSLSNKNVESVTSNPSVALTGIGLDGIHIKTTNYLSVSHKIAIGFDLGSWNDALIFKSDAGNSIASVLFDKLSVIAQNEALGVTFNELGLSANSAANLGLYASDTSKEVLIGSSASNYALAIKSNRLNSAVPFPVSAGTVPTKNSSDSNTLDEYQEVTFTPTVYFGTLPTVAAGLTNVNPTISLQSGVMTKIGNVVSFMVKFQISNWTVSTTTGRVAPPYYSNPYAGLSVNVGDIADTAWSAMQHPIGSEAYQVIIRGIPDHWPNASVSEKMKFSVSLTTPSPTMTTGYLLRPFAMSYTWNGGSSSIDWQPMDPASIYAKFGHYSGPGSTLPQLTLHGNRQNISGGMTCALESNLSIYDFLNYVHPTNSDGNVIEVTITGSYITAHQTAQDVHPQGVTTTTTTQPTTTTTTDPLTTTTTTTSSPTTTTTTTASPTTTTTTAPSGFGDELVSNADSDYF